MFQAEVKTLSKRLKDTFTSKLFLVFINSQASLLEKERITVHGPTLLSRIEKVVTDR